jgi:hypothetical protein
MAIQAARIPQLKKPSLLRLPEQSGVLMNHAPAQAVKMFIVRWAPVNSSSVSRASSMEVFTYCIIASAPGRGGSSSKALC